MVIFLGEELSDSDVDDFVLFLSSSLLFSVEWFVVGTDVDRFFDISDDSSFNMSSLSSGVPTTT